MDKGKGRARTVDLEESQKPTPKPKSTEETLADILRHIVEISKATPTPCFPNEAGPSGSSPSHSTAKPAVTEREQAQIDCAIALSSVEQFHNSLTRLRTNSVLPTELGHYATSTGDRDETSSVSSTLSSDLTKLIPYTNTNKPVYKYENELNGLLQELDKVDSHGNAEVRQKRKQVVKAVERALECVGDAVGEAVEKQLLLVFTTTPATEESLKGFDVDKNVTEEVAPAPEQAETLVVVDEVIVPEPFTQNQVNENIVTSMEGFSPIDKTLPESNAPAVSEMATDLPVEPTSTKSDIETSMAMITTTSVELTPVTELKPTQSQIQVNTLESVDMFLLPEQVTPPSPVIKPREINVDTDDDILVLNSNIEKSDWSKLEEH